LAAAHRAEARCQRRRKPLGAGKDRPHTSCEPFVLLGAALVGLVDCEDLLDIEVSGNIAA